MPYQPLQLATDTPAIVRSFIQKNVEDHCFKDLHTMLRLPQPSMGLGAGLNFAIAQSLLAAIGGISATLYASEGEPGELFIGLLRDHYPWNREPHPALNPEAAAGYLYNVFRNPLTHALGVFTERVPNSSRRYIVARKDAVKIKRLAPGGVGLEDLAIEALENSSVRPPMSATLTVLPDRKVLLVEGLYWGTRCMLEALTRDSNKMQEAESFVSRIV